MGATHSGHSAANRNQPTILYLHIPKAAGTTLSTMLADRLGRGQVLVIQNTRKASEELAALPETQRVKLRLITGHFEYGLHTGLRQPFEYITMLRDPVDRLISHYYYMLRNPTHYLHQRVTSEKMSLKDYALAGITKELDNGQVRFLSGAFYRHPYGQCPHELLEHAKENLRNHFAVVGLAERFDETVLLLGTRYQWKDVNYVRKNVTSERPNVDELSTDTLEAIRSVNLLDIELYAFATELFEAALRRLKTS